MRHETSDMENNLGYRKLNVYRVANDLVLEVYKVTKNYPKDELFGLVSQMRRCSVSVVANIVEGYGRRTKNEKNNFYFIAKGSLTELEYYIDLSLQLNYINKGAHDILIKIRNDAGRLLYGFIKSIK